MARKLRVDKIQRIIKNHKRLMKELDVKITNRGKEVTIDGTPEKEYDAVQVIEALNFGFPFTAAISIKEEGTTLETINIKEHTQKANHERIRGRIIGKGGKALQTLSNLTNSYMELKENKVGIIATPEYMENATEALIAIIKGAKHSNVYKGLEKSHPQLIEDLGLKGEKTRKTLEEFQEEFPEEE